MTNPHRAADLRRHADRIVSEMDPRDVAALAAEAIALNLATEATLSAAYLGHTLSVLGDLAPSLAAFLRRTLHAARRHVDTERKDTA